MFTRIKRWLTQILTTLIFDREWSHPSKVLWCLVFGTVLVLWILFAVPHMMPPNIRLYDFAQEWSSARNFYVDQAIYLDLQESFALHFADGRGTDISFAYNAHPPTSVLLALPFGMLEYDLAYMVWNLVSLLALGGSLLLIMRSKGLSYSPWSLLPILSLLLISEPFAQQMRHGQLNLILLLLIAGTWAAERSGRFRLSGVLLAIATAIKLFPGLLFFYLLARRRWRSLFYGVATFIFLTAATAVMFGWDSLQFYVTEVVPTLRAYSDRWGVASITGFWSRIFNATTGKVIPLYQDPAMARIFIVLTSAALVTATAWKTWRTRSGIEQDHAFGLWCIAMLLLAPLTWPHAFLLLILPLALMWKHLPRWPGHAVILGFIIVVIPNPRWLWNLTITGDADLASGVAAVALPIHSLTVLSYQFYALLALFLFALFSMPKCSAEGKT